MPIDLSKTSTPFDPGALIPSGTAAPMQISVKPGGYGESGLLTAAETSKGRSAYLHLEFVITGGPHKGRKLWKRSTVEGDDHAARPLRSLSIFSARLPGPPTISARLTQVRKSTPSLAASTSARSTS
jgi:hypothetical protein